MKEMCLFYLAIFFFEIRNRMNAKCMNLIQNNICSFLLLIMLLECLIPNDDGKKLLKFFPYVT